MPTTKRQNFRSTVRYLVTGVAPTGDKTDANGATDAPGTPPTPIQRDDFPTALTPWIDGYEDPQASTGLMASPDPSLMVPDVGASPIVGAYEGAVRTEGPASYWPGQEVSGGPYGDQALNRRMMFRLPIVMAGPDTPIEGKVQDTHWQDELAASILNNGQGTVSDSDINQSLILWDR